MKFLSLKFVGFALAVSGITVQAAECREGFENVSTLQSRGWSMQNNSDPLGSTGWFQGKPGIFPAYSGATNSYVAADMDSAGSAGYPVLSNWLVTPEIVFGPGTTFGFYTRAFPGAANRVVVRLCIESGSTNCTAPGPQSGDRGGFLADLADINPEQSEDGYPSVWTHYQFTPMDGLPTSGRGRIAFHYYGFWQSSVPLGSAIGIDEVTVAGASGCPLTEFVFADGFD